MAGEPASGDGTTPLKPKDGLNGAPALELVRRRSTRDRRSFPKLTPMRLMIVVGVAVLYFIFQDKLWSTAFQAAFGTIYFFLAVLVVCSVLGPVFWYLGKMVFPGIWRARRLRILRYRRALRDCNYRETP